MKDLDGARRDLEAIMRSIMRAQDELDELRGSTLPVGLQDELRAEVNRRLDSRKQDLLTELQQIVDFPPRHLRHFPLLAKFWEDGDYKHSVFVMTKFPEAEGDAKSAELERVIQAVSSEVTAKGFVPRVARFPDNFHPGLWDNVELHLLGCRQGIAIVEDRYLPELNPNVAMEWGWMRGMGKRVLFLREAEFTHFRADLGDLLNERFDWSDPEPRIRAAVGGWLKTIDL